MTWIVQWWCGIRGHDDLFVASPYLHLECRHCLRKTKGWPQ